MANNENAKPETHAEHDESVFVLRMVGIEETNGVLVKKNGLCFFERDFVLFNILFVFALAPFESNLIHMYSVCIIPGTVNVSFWSNLWF